MALTLPYPDLTFVPLDILTADEMNEIVANYTYIAAQFPVSSASLDWSTLNSAPFPTAQFAFGSQNKDAAKIRLGDKLYAFTYHGGTGLTSATSGYQQISLSYSDFALDTVLFAYVKYSVTGQVPTYTGHSSFGLQTADTYCHCESTGNNIGADLIIIGTVTS